MSTPDILCQLRFGGQISSIITPPSSTSASSPFSPSKNVNLNVNSANNNSTSGVANLSSTAIRFHQPSKELNERYHNMHTIISNLRAKATRNFRSLSRITVIQELFDPSRTADLISFIALGGLDVVIEILCDDDLFASPSSVLTPAQARMARLVLTDYIRLIDEAMIVNINIAWYVLTNYPRLVYRVLELMRLDKVRDKCFSMMEHLVSAIGPIWNVNESVQLNRILFGLTRTSRYEGNNNNNNNINNNVLLRSNDLLYCRAARVLSISVVPMVVAGPGVDIGNPDPYPHSFGTRMKAFHEVATRNSELLCQFEVIKRLVGLISYSRDTRRRGDGGGGHSRPNSATGANPFQARTITGPGGEQMQALEVSASALQDIIQQSTGSSNVFEVLQLLQVLSGGQMSISPSSSGGSGGGGQLQVTLGAVGGAAESRRHEENNSNNNQNEYDDEDDYEDDEWEDENNGDGDNRNHNNYNNVESQLNQILAGLQRVNGNREDIIDEDGEGGDDDDEDDDDQQQGEDVDFRAPGDLNVDDNAMLFSRFLNDLAVENAVNNDEAGTVDDSADCPWFVGEPDSERLWRLNDLRIDEKNVPPPWTASCKSIVSKIQALAPTPEEEKEMKFLAPSATMPATHQAREESPLEARSLHDRKFIISCQSEVLYLLNSLMTGLDGVQVWFSLNKLRVGEPFFKLLNWFVEVQPSVDAAESKAQTLAINPSLPDITADFNFDSLFKVQLINGGDDGDDDEATLLLRSSLPSFLAQLRVNHLVNREDRNRSMILKNEMNERNSNLARQFQREFVLRLDDSDQQHQQFQRQQQDEKSIIASTTFFVDNNNNNNNNDGGDDDDDAVSVATSVEPDLGGHQHNQDTLVRIEVVRCIHDFWDSKTCEESYFVRRSHFFSTPPTANNNNSNNNKLDPGHLLAHQIFDLLIKLLVRGSDDPCVENLTTVAVEGMLRGQGSCVHRLDERRKTQERILRSLTFPLLDRLLLRNPRGISILRKLNIPVSGPLPPFDIPSVSHRRLEATFSVIGDACKFVPHHWAVVECWIAERDMISFIRDRLLKCSLRMTHFVRSYFSTRFQDMCCPVLLSTSPSGDDWIQPFCEGKHNLSSKSVQEAAEILVDYSNGNVNNNHNNNNNNGNFIIDRVVEDSKLFTEPSYIVTERFYAVRKKLLLDDDNSPSRETFLLHSPLDELVSALEEISSNHSLIAEANQIRWFSSPSLSCAPTLKPETGKVKLEEYLRQRRSLSSSSSSSSSSSNNNSSNNKSLLENVYCPQLSKLMNSLFVPMLSRLMLLTIADDVDSTDKLHVTVVLLLLGGILFESGREELKRVVQEACSHHQLRRKKLLERIGRARKHKKQQQQRQQRGDDDDNDDFFHAENQRDHHHQTDFFRSNSICCCSAPLFKQGAENDDGDNGDGDDDDEFFGLNNINDDDDDDDDDDDIVSKLFDPIRNRNRLHCLHCGTLRKMDAGRSTVLRVPCAARSFLQALCLWISYYATHPRNFHTVYFTTQLDVRFYNDIIREVIPILREICVVVPKK